MRGAMGGPRVLLRRLREVMAEPGFQAPARLRGELSFENVSFTYGAHPAIAPEAVTETLPVVAALHTNGSNGSNGNTVTNNGAATTGTETENVKLESLIFASPDPAIAHPAPSEGKDGDGSKDGKDSKDKEVKAKSHAVALSGITFHVKPGQRVALLGTAGAGKTTLVNLLPRFYDYTGGRILLDGVDLKQYSREYLRRNIGIVEQEPFLFSRTVRENITFSVGSSVAQSEVEAAAKAAAEKAGRTWKPPGRFTPRIDAATFEDKRSDEAELEEFERVERPASAITSLGVDAAKGVQLFKDEDGHIHFSYDLESGLRKYKEKRSKKSWFGGLGGGFVDVMTGNGIAFDAFRADDAEFNHYDDQFEDLVESTGELPVAVSIDKGNAVRDFYEYNTRRGVATACSFWRTSS